MNLKIALSGPAGTGKSTILNDIKNSQRFHNLTYDVGEFKLIEEPVRTLKKEAGMLINELGTIDTELLVLSTHIKNLFLYPRFITDRCIVDNITYSKLSTDFEDKDKYLESALFIESKVIENYDLIFYIRPEFHPPEDGVRNLGDFYHASVKGFDERYSDLMAKYNNIHILAGSREERIDSIFLEIDKLISNDIIGEND